MTHIICLYWWTSSLVERGLHRWSCHRLSRARHSGSEQAVHVMLPSLMARVWTLSTSLSRTTYRTPPSRWWLGYEHLARSKCCRRIGRKVAHLALCNLNSKDRFHTPNYGFPSSHCQFEIKTHGRTNLTLFTTSLINSANIQVHN